MTNSEISARLGALYESLVVLKQQVREVGLIALATKDTLANLHPRGEEIYEKAYNEHSRLTASTHNQVIDGWQQIAAELKALK
jgi:hypothetical protein